MEFLNFKNAVAAKFAEMATGELFVVDVDKDLMWQTYLASFPEGTNPIYRTRAEYDCNCCRQFIRAVGNVVAIKNNKLVSIWDVDVAKKEPEFQIVADAMSKLVKGSRVSDVFMHYENHAGTNKSFEQMESGVRTWNHFYVTIPSKFVKTKDKIPSLLSVIRSSRDLFLRGLKEINSDAVETVSDLIAQNSLLRGAEKKFIVDEFAKIQKFVAKQKNFDLDLYAWDSVGKVHERVLGIKNDVVGTLLMDLSTGVDLEIAVKSFENKVSGTNYQRTTALVTPKMRDAAKKKLEELGLVSALERRFANLSDININNVLFADRTIAKKLYSDVFDDIATKTATKNKNLDKVEEIAIDKFLKDILPKASSIELYVENSHAKNFVSMIAPVDPTANNLFKWNNPFSWTYAGDVADSVKERVKNAGGNVTAELCCRLAWYNFDDLDLHLYGPGNTHVYFGNKHCRFAELDVDMNAGCGRTRTPVENIFSNNVAGIPAGKYELRVHNFNKRESIDVGFEVEIELFGETYHFVHENALRDCASVVVATLIVDKKNGVYVEGKFNKKNVSKEVFGLMTNNYHRVSSIMLSPNFWETGVGNKHFFFMLDGAKNDGSARGFYNEFLRDDLKDLRKTLELVGAKMSVAGEDDQLTGLGFSSTQRNSVLCKVGGSFTRIVKIVF